MKTITLVLAAFFLFSACSTLPPEPPLTQEQIQIKKDNLANAFMYFANKRMVIVDGDSSFDEFEIRPLDDGVSADYIFYKVKKNKEFKYTLTNCMGGMEVNAQYLHCDLRDKYEDNAGGVYIHVDAVDETWKDGRIIPTHKTVHAKKGDMIIRVFDPYKNTSIRYTEFAVFKFKN